MFFSTIFICKGDYIRVTFFPSACAPQCRSIKTESPRTTWRMGLNSHVWPRAASGADRRVNRRIGGAGSGGAHASLEPPNETHTNGGSVEWPGPHLQVHLQLQLLHSEWSPGPVSVPTWAMGNGQWAMGNGQVIHTLFDKWHTTFSRLIIVFCLPGEGLCLRWDFYFLILEYPSWEWVWTKVLLYRMMHFKRYKSKMKHKLNLYLFFIKKNKF